MGALISALRRTSSQFSSANFNSTERLVTISASNLFDGLSDKECGEIASCAEVQSFGQNELLFAQGQAINHLSVLQTGIVKLTKLNSTGSETILWMHGAGDALSGPPETPSCRHTCSALGLEQGKALKWKFTLLRELFMEYPQVRTNLNCIMSSRLCELEQRFFELATKRVAPRLALVLLRLAEKIGKPSREGIEVNLSGEDLAQMTGTTVFTISRILAKWSKQGFVSSRREVVTLYDLAQLEVASEVIGKRQIDPPFSKTLRQLQNDFATEEACEQ